jgi:hypothetical protein
MRKGVSGQESSQRSCLREERMPYVWGEKCLEYQATKTANVMIG